VPPPLARETAALLSCGRSAAFERDRLRDAELWSDGFAVMRVTWRQIVHQPQALVARLAQRLSSAEWR
jgi:very-short-patch-repair endonuclease